MNKTELASRVRNSLYGLAIGDAINWNSVFNRSFGYPFWTRRLRREIDLDQDNNNIIKTSLPFSLNQHSDNFDFSPTDDTEWEYLICAILSLMMEIMILKFCKG